MIREKTNFLSNFWEELCPFLEVQDLCKLKKALDVGSSNPPTNTLARHAKHKQLMLLNEQISDSLFAFDSNQISVLPSSSSLNLSNEGTSAECQSTQEGYNFESFWGKMKILVSEYKIEDSKESNLENSFDEFLIQERLEKMKKAGKTNGVKRKVILPLKHLKKGIVSSQKVKSRIQISRKRTQPMKEAQILKPISKKSKTEIVNIHMTPKVNKNINKREVQIKSFKKPKKPQKSKSKRKKIDFVKYLINRNSVSKNQILTTPEPRFSIKRGKKSQKTKRKNVILLRKIQMQSLEKSVNSSFKSYEFVFSKWFKFENVKLFISESTGFIEKHIFQNSKISFENSFVEKFFGKESKLYTSSKTNHRMQCVKVRNLFLGEDPSFCVSHIREKVKALILQDLELDMADKNDQVACLVQMIFFSNLERFLESLNLFSSRFGKVFCSNKQYCLRCPQHDESLESRSSCCRIFHFIKVDYLIQLYISKMGLRNLFNFERLSQLKPVLSSLFNSKIEGLALDISEQNRGYLEKFNEFLFFQISQYSVYFPRSQKRLEKRTISKNLKILIKVVSKFENLSEKQRTMIHNRNRSRRTFPQKNKISLDYLLGLINQPC